MSMFKRLVLLVIGTLLGFSSLPYVLHKELYLHVDHIQMTWNVIIGFVVAIYNLAIIYKKATTIQVVIDSKDIEKRIAEKERGETL